jgi:hypothetical protein
MLCSGSAPRIHADGHHVPAMERDCVRGRTGWGCFADEKYLRHLLLAFPWIEVGER